MPRPETDTIASSNDIDHCLISDCDMFRTWQESLFLSGTHSDSKIYEMSEDKLAECMAANGCVFEQTVQIQGVRNA